jgi:elongation factor Ts
VIGENIKLRRFAKLTTDNGFIASYMHASVADNLGKIGVLVSIECNNINEDARLLAKQIAMHIAASNPVSVSKEDVPAEIIAKEKEIFTDQSKASGKPDNIIEKMVEGRIRKFYDEIVLLEQAFVIDGKTKLQDLIDGFSKKNNISFKVKDFIRYELGEGIEKKEDNFVEEANSMATSS